MSRHLVITVICVIVFYVQISAAQIDWDELGAGKFRGFSPDDFDRSPEARFPNSRPSISRTSEDWDDTRRPLERRPAIRRPPNSRPAIPGRRPVGQPDILTLSTRQPTDQRPSPPSTRRTTERECSCPSTTEYNPVCGTDGISYTNPGKLNCARRCGKDVSLLHYGNCTPTDPNAPSSTSTTTPSSTALQRGGRVERV